MSIGGSKSLFPSPAQKENAGAKSNQRERPGFNHRWTQITTDFHQTLNPQPFSASLPVHQILKIFYSQVQILFQGNNQLVAPGRRRRIRLLRGKNAILQVCSNEDQIREQVLSTVIHEIGHHFGLSEADLRK